MHDLAGVVYYANYLRFIERGRSEALRDLGIDQVAMKRDLGLVFVVRSLTIDYLSPAIFDDMLEVRTRVTRLRGASVEMAQEVWRGEGCLRTDFAADFGPHGALGAAVWCAWSSGSPRSEPRIPRDHRS